jgi:ketosteroid isomerase-like protein
VDLDEAVEQYRQAWSALVTGDPGPAQALYSHADDVSLANPWGPPWRGCAQVRQALASAAARYRDGELLALDEVSRYTSSELACLLETERFLARVGDRAEAIPFALRVTTVYRREGLDWKVVHRHADAITTPQLSDVALGLGYLRQ